MFISHQHKLIFFEVPRTGSTSVTRALVELDPESPTVKTRESKGGGWGYHYITDKEVLQDREYRLVAAHRNPYDRLWSFWKHRKLSGNPEHFRKTSWARYVDWVCDPSTAPELSQGAMGDRPIAELLDLERVDFWLDYHRLLSSWERLARDLELPLPPLKRLNASADYGAMHHAYSPERARQVAARFAADFDFFGYEPDSWKAGAPLESASTAS